MDFKPKLIPLLIVLFAGLLWPYGVSLQASLTFSDIQDSPYKASIEYLAEKGVVQGYPDGSFGPTKKINRAEIIKIILEASADEDIGFERQCFKDVGNDWFARYVCYAKNKKIVEGYADGAFRPEKNVNMAEALKMGIESFPVSIGASSGAWYQKYIDFVHNNNIFSRYSVLPQKDMTRGEMAYLIHQLMMDKDGSKKLTGVHNNKTAGCGQIPPSPTPTSSVISGTIRHYITVIPSGYDKNKPTSLVFAFHGRTNPNTQVRGYYKVEEASKGQAIFIYPAGLPEAGPSRSWSDPGDKSDNLRDFALFDQLLEEFSNNYCVDLDRVYVVGHSLGAWFTNSLACARGDKIRAIGSVGGGTTLNECTGPVAALIMHNPKDRLSPFSSGETARDQLISQNQCSAKTLSTSPTNLKCVAYQECNPVSPVVWCPHNEDYDYRGTYYPHTWPKSAGSEIWKFFENLK